MRKYFNFKADWMLAIENLPADCRLAVFQIISVMGLHDVDIDEALSIEGIAVDNADAMALLAEVEKVMRRRRRARQRAALRRKAIANADKGADCNDNNSCEQAADVDAAVIDSSTQTAGSATTYVDNITNVNSSLKKESHKRHKRRHKNKSRSRR